MKRAHILFGWTFIGIILLSSCKNDTEADLIVKSDITGVYINEVYSMGPDWIELYNSTNTEIDLSACKLQDSKGVEEELSLKAGTKIAAKSFLLLNEVSDFTFGISSKGGDQVVLLDPNRAIIDQVVVPVMAAEQSYARIDDGNETWAITDNVTQGMGNLETPPVVDPDVLSDSPIVINEIFSNNDKKSSGIDSADYVELYNSGNSDIDISGFTLFDSEKSDLKKTVIKSGTILASKKFLVVDQLGFGLSSKSGDKVYLYDAAKALIDTVATPPFEAGDLYSVGRKTDGSEEFVIFKELSKGSSNNGKPIKE